MKLKFRNLLGSCISTVVLKEASTMNTNGKIVTRMIAARNR